MFPEDPISVSEFISLLNQTFEFAYPTVSIVGELSNLRISKNKWVYFDLKDEESSLKFFGSVYILKHPLEDGMMVRISSYPKMHNLYGFSMQVQSIQPVGEGSIKRANELLMAKLSSEGLFDAERKRQIPYPPKKIGLITSFNSAAYHDFIKIINARWSGIEIDLFDVQVQGIIAAEQIIDAINYFNKQEDIETLVIIRGGGSPEDLITFSSEELTRVVAASKIPTLAAIGHEIDTSLVELAADLRASTPSNAAELLVPDKKILFEQLTQNKINIDQYLLKIFTQKRAEIEDVKKDILLLIKDNLRYKSDFILNKKEILEAYNPKKLLERGYSVVYKGDKILRTVKEVSEGENVRVVLSDGEFDSTILNIKKKG